MELLGKKEIKGNDNQTIQGNGNTGNSFTKNYYYKDVDSGLALSIEEDLKELIIVFKESFNEKEGGEKSSKNDFNKIELSKKNTLNNLSEVYYTNVMKDHYPYFYDIDDFLKDERNKELKEMFYDIVEELKTKQITHVESFESFEKFIDQVRDQVLLKYKTSLKRKKKFVLIFLHYMYCRCLIGKKVLI